ncbi:MAG TPA: tetratricopeptide repeat protein [Phycisphaerae bacterium]|nr:tetratricopeptide repeat protein [Phycisphaerae bacterium]
MIRALQDILVAVILVAPAAGPAGAMAADPPDQPADQTTATDQSPESRRLDDKEFRDGLRKRGLIDLLEHHLNESPPADDVEADLLRRELLLAAAADESRPESERSEAQAQADRMLEELIARHPQHEASLQWRLDLGQSLLYRQGEPFAVRLLYRGGNPGDRRRLIEIMSRAVQVLDELLAALAAEYQRLDQLNLAEYERLERKGHIERLEQMEPHACYMRRWAVFYRAMAQNPDDPARIRELRYVTEDLRDSTDLLTTPHDVSHLQAQSLLLSGMAHRLLADYDAALEQLAGAVTAVDRLSDPVERRDLQWAITLARLETVKALRDARRYEQALSAADDFEAWVSVTSASNLGLELVGSLLKASVHRAQARRARLVGNDSLARRLEDRALQPLIALARKSDAHRNAVYATLYETIDPDRDPATLHPFERGALIAALLGEADALSQPAADGQTPGPEPDDEQNQARRARMLNQAIAIGRQLLAESATLDRSLVGEIHYNLGVAHYRLGDRLESVRSFLTTARDYPTFSLAESAAAAAVQTAAEIYKDPGLQKRPEVRDLYLETLTVLTRQYPRSSAAPYWQYFLAQTLEEAGRYREAADEYATVIPTHEHYTQARFQHMYCLVQAARALADQPDADPVGLLDQARTAVSAARRFVAEATAGRLDNTDPARLERLVARALVNQAETYALPGVERHREVLETLDGFEQNHPQSPDLIGRVLRVRIIAYEALGRLEEAAQAIPRYIESDPAHAGATLQGLFDAAAAEIERLRQAGRPEQARRKAEAALLVAQQIDAWAQTPAARLSERNRYALRLQLAEAHLAAGRHQDARRLFEQCIQRRADIADEAGAEDARAIFGLAQACFELQRYDDALPLYNRIFRQAQPTTALWWRALLGDLKCRAELGEDPQDLIRVIRQQRFLHPDLGGPQLQAEFEALLQDQQRAAGVEG